MSAINLQIIVACLSVLIAAIGIPALYLQLRDLKHSLKVGSHTAIYAQAAAVRGHLIEYPELRKYFFDGVEISPSDQDYSRVLSIAEVYLNYLESIAVLDRNFGVENFDSLHSFIATALRNSPVMRDHLQGHPEIYSHALHKFLAQVTESISSA